VSKGLGLVANSRLASRADLAEAARRWPDLAAAARDYYRAQAATAEAEAETNLTEDERRLAIAREHGRRAIGEDLPNQRDADDPRRQDQSGDAATDAKPGENPPKELTARKPAPLPVRDKFRDVEAFTKPEPL